MTLGLLETIIIKNKILKNVCLINDSENDLCTTDMNGIQYCKKKNEICFMEGECIHKQEHADNEEWKLQWSVCDGSGTVISVENIFLI